MVIIYDWCSNIPHSNPLSENELGVLQKLQTIMHIKVEKLPMSYNLNEYRKITHITYESNFWNLFNVYYKYFTDSLICAQSPIKVLLKQLHNSLKYKTSVLTFSINDRLSVKVKLKNRSSETASSYSRLGSVVFIYHQVRIFGPLHI